METNQANAQVILFMRTCFSAQWHPFSQTKMGRLIKLTMFQTAVVSVDDSFYAITVWVPGVSVEGKAMTGFAVDVAPETQGKEPLVNVAYVV